MSADRACADTSVPVELELVLAADTSASVDDAEFSLQMLGIALALRDPDVVAAIEAHAPFGIAMTLVLWSEGPRQALGWTHLVDAGSAYAFADAVERAPRAAVGVTTSIGSAIALARELIASNGFDGRRRSIDVSGDGTNNSGLPLWTERHRALADGITINGLAILDREPQLDVYYREHVVGGAGAFVYVANGFNDFARAFRDKLLREIIAFVAFDPPNGRERLAGPARP